MDRHESVQARCSATDQEVAIVTRESPVTLLAAILSAVDHLEDARAAVASPVP